MQPKKTALSGPPKGQPAGTAARVLAVLEALSRRRAIALEELSRQVKLAKSTVYRFLLTLQKLGYVRRNDDDRWALTLKMFNVGLRSLDQMKAYPAARVVAENLANELGETIHIGVRDGDSVVYVLKIDSPRTIRMYSRVGRRVPLYCTAMGKIFLAFMTIRERNGVLKGEHLLAMTRDTITSRSALDEQLSLVRTQGHATDNEEFEENVLCMAAPIRDHAGAVIAALSVSWPSFRHCPSEENDMVGKVKAAAATISRFLGYETHEPE